MQAAWKESWQALESGLLRHRPQQPGSWSRTARNHVFGISTARSSQHTPRAQRPRMPAATGSPSSSRHSCSQSQALRAAAATAAAQRRQLIARQGGVEGEAGAAGAVVLARHGWRWRWWRVVATSLAVASQLLKVVARQEIVEVAAGSSRARVRACGGRRRRRGRGRRRPPGRRRRHRATAGAVAAKLIKIGAAEVGLERGASAACACV